MKQLPGQRPPQNRWLTLVLQGIGAVVMTIWLASLLPYLLLLSLLVALLLIPTLRSLRKEAQQMPVNPFAGTPLEALFSQLQARTTPRPMVDVTPPHRKAIRAFWLWRQQRRP